MRDLKLNEMSQSLSSSPSFFLPPLTTSTTAQKCRNKHRMDTHTKRKKEIDVVFFFKQLTHALVGPGKSKISRAAQMDRNYSRS